MAALLETSASAEPTVASGIGVRLDVVTFTGLLACAAGTAGIVGALAPWFSFTFLNLVVHVDGTSRDLSGYYAIGLSAAIILLGLALTLLPRTVVIGRLFALGFLGFAIGGTIMMWRQFNRLAQTARLIRHTPGISPFAKYFNAHAGAGWGFWLDAAAFASLVIVAGFALLGRHR